MKTTTQATIIAAKTALSILQKMGHNTKGHQETYNIIAKLSLSQGCNILSEEQAYCMCKQLEFTVDYIYRRIQDGRIKRKVSIIQRIKDALTF